MVTLATYRRGREVIGRCDASCYDGSDERCVCLICRGQNHGVGLDAAIAQTKAIIAEWYVARAADGGPQRDRIVLGLPVVQLVLF
ncbi:hypothetical protein [Nonomuraea sp. NEAU-A123]|uniref:hypothetical protein n=1 Tax=Nonomuraea sp. NEAU-A123 TaxID=2839649 RepID=UPI001BE3FA7A|nr:hypothetical protein [Nonomuraea sp. NEAU-A123]MBT2226228.1 hypothetical protein [Nonomuraea sp. NEAU-A123]